MSSLLVQPFDICPASNTVNRQDDKNKGKTKGCSKTPSIHQLKPGMILLKSFVRPEDQIEIVQMCRQYGVGSGGFYQPRYPNGATMKLWMMCLGKNWDPVTGSYGQTRPGDGARVPAIPAAFQQIVQTAITSVDGVPAINPDICIVNFYTEAGKLGLHQDKDESSHSINQGLPVISISLGDTAEFMYGESRAKESASKVNLESGDVLILGGRSRLLFHGISHVKPNTAPKWLTEATSLRPGRLNLTFRQY